MGAFLFPLHLYLMRSVVKQILRLREKSISEIPLLALLGLQASRAGPTGASPAADPRKHATASKIHFQLIVHPLLCLEL
jgi:hypothetical protein